MSEYLVFHSKEERIVARTCKLTVLQIRPFYHKAMYRMLDCRPER
jgi:hypothetical protein